MLCDLMAATGVLGKPQSFYRPESITLWTQQLSVKGDHATGSSEFERGYLAAIQKHGTDTSGTFGLRLMWDSVEGLAHRLLPIFGDQLSDAALFERAFGQPLYVNLVRKDKVAQAVSLIRAEQSGQWHLSTDGSVRQGTEEPKPVTYDAQSIGKEITSLSRDDAAWQAWFATQGLSPLQVTYEDLAKDPQAMVAEILEVSGHDRAIAQSIKPVTAKMADEESRQWIERYRRDTA
tara:strand:- start:4712 stop:5413 length:702 start_codon:yes stop_codon:yes gene_type:complete